jgi:hypothetical protein
MIKLIKRIYHYFSWVTREEYEREERRADYYRDMYFKEKYGGDNE